MKILFNIKRHCGLRPAIPNAIGYPVCHPELDSGSICWIASPSSPPPYGGILNQVQNDRGGACVRCLGGILNQVQDDMGYEILHCVQDDSVGQ